MKTSLKLTRILIILRNINYYDSVIEPKYCKFQLSCNKPNLGLYNDINSRPLSDGPGFCPNHVDNL